MKMPENLEGMRFVRLTAINLARKDKNGKTIWNCKCDCGNECRARWKNVGVAVLVTEELFNKKTKKIFVEVEE